MSNHLINKERISMVIAQQDFRDEEYFIPKGLFEAAGFEVQTVSMNRGEAIGTFGSLVNVDLVLDEVKVADFAAIVFVGGDGMAKLMNNEKLHSLAQMFAGQDKVIGAICIAPAILAKTGVLLGKKATVWTSENDKSAKEILEQADVHYIDKPVVVDGRIITANGPSAARRFAEEIIKILTSCS